MFTELPIHKPFSCARAAGLCLLMAAMSRSAHGHGTIQEALEEGLRQATSQQTTLGVMDEHGLNFLLDQESPDERRVYVVRRLLFCDGQRGLVVACSRAPGRTTVIALGGDAITLLHELGHQAGLGDRPDPGLLMSRGWPAPRVGTGIRAAEIAYFRRLFSPPKQAAAGVLSAHHPAALLTRQRAPARSLEWPATLSHRPPVLQPGRGSCGSRQAPAPTWPPRWSPHRYPLNW